MQYICSKDDINRSNPSLSLWILIDNAFMQAYSRRKLSKYVVTQATTKPTTRKNIDHFSELNCHVKSAVQYMYVASQ